MMQVGLFLVKIQVSTPLSIEEALDELYKDRPD